jgi:hypothetical protein
MPSPFPGMNPFLEQEEAWHDFHERFMPAAAARLSPQVGENYIVKIDENVYIHEIEGNGSRRLLGRGGVFVAELPPGSASASATATLDAPATIELAAVDVESDSVIEIRDRWSRELVTIIELLSPSNKMPGLDRDQYLSKRRRILHSSTHLVEIDLLRGGSRMPGVIVPRCDYCVVVSRAEDRPRAGMWPIPLREPLPKIPIPLRPGDPLPQLDLQEVLNEVYDGADYRKYIYAHPPRPLLSAEDEAWAKALIVQ